MKRITIAQMLGVVGVIALGLAALRAGTEIWLEAVHSLTLVLLLASLVGALVRPRGRPSWIGFAVFGWAIYAMMNNNLLSSDYSARFLGYDTISEAFATFQRKPTPPPGLPPIDSKKFGDLVRIYMAMEGDSASGTPRGLDPAFIPYFRAWEAYNLRVNNAQAIGYLLVCLAMGLVGAVVGRVLGPRGGPVATMGPSS